MRFLLKQLPLFLMLLIPLAVLAWLGSRELTRLEEQANTLLTAEAHRYLQNEEQFVVDEIHQLAFELMGKKLTRTLRSSSIVEATQKLREQPFVLHALVADKNYKLVAPRSPETRTPSVPLAAPILNVPRDQDPNRDLLIAEVLSTMYDDAGARQHLQNYVNEEAETPRSPEGLAWAYFRLATLQSKLPDSGDEVGENYLYARDAAGRSCQTRPTADAATIILLTQLRENQIATDSEKRMLHLLETIAAGRQVFEEYIGDDVLNWVVREISDHQLSSAAAEDVSRRENALALNRIRSSLRSFATDYEDRIRRRLLETRSGRVHEHNGIRYLAVTTGDTPGLLMMRRATPQETRRSATMWVGMVLDLPALIGSTARRARGNVGLAIYAPSGVPVLAGPTPVPSGDKELPTFAPLVSDLARLEFVAVPVTSPADLQSAARNQGVLFLILVFVALGGAFLLIRSVRRETELARTKVNLLSRVSHELKTPLAVIKMYGETLGLGRTKDQGQVSRFAGIIQAEADRLTGMVERILDFSKMEAGTFQYDKELLNLSEFIATVGDEYLPHIESQGLDYTSHIEPGLFAHVDPRALASSVINLLENALKYTPEDAPERTLHIDLTSKNGKARLEVRDRGVGIPRSEHEKIFTDFYRASNAGEVRGAGIGLSLVDHFARSHDGKIEALDRTDGSGTIMRLTLPLSNPQASQTQS